MRDEKRIDKFTQQVREFWHTYPDWRFGQFMCNFLGFVTTETKRDPFFIEDDEMASLLKKYYDQLGGK